MKAVFQYGIDVLCHRHTDWLRGRRIGLVAHPASVNSKGLPSPAFLRQKGFNLTCLFGPEHGFDGHGGAGEKMPGQKHSQWQIPVYSLYGNTRKPTGKMLENLDVIVFDLQDLGARPYTFVSTLRYVLEAAAGNDKRIVVTDRPAPLANVVDGPMLDPDFESFVGFVRTPVVYGMTPGEMALWLKKNLKLNVDLLVAPMTGWQRGRRPERKWIPPSPAIKSWECGLCFPITVFLEALPALDHGRGTKTPFQLVGAPWLDAKRLWREMINQKLPGVRFANCSYRAMAGNYRGQTVHGLGFQVLDTNEYLPVQTGIAIIYAVQRLYGAGSLWSHIGTREAFFDQLLGTDSVRRALQSDKAIPRWDNALRGFRKKRQTVLLYAP